MPKFRLWQLPYFFERLMTGDRFGGIVRLITVIALSLLYAVLARMVFEQVDSAAIAESWRGNFFVRTFVPIIVLRILAELFNGATLRYLLVPIFALLGVLMLASRYVQDIYELKKMRFALRYLLASVFAIDYPRLVIDDGKKQVKPGETNLLDVIGGPGYVIIRPGNVVLFERLHGPSNVRAAGRYFIPRLESIREIASLDDQHGYIEETSAITKDGVRVTVRDVHYRYRLRTGYRWGDQSKAPRTPYDPYPFAVQAVRNMAYRRSVRATGIIPWFDAVRIAVDGVITDYIAAHKLDDVTAPRQPGQDPRAEIVKKLYAKGLRDALKNIGTELLWCDIGHFDVPDPADQQHVDTWKSRWSGAAMVTEAYGKAQREAFQELGRAEAQADVLVSIVRSLEEIPHRPNDPKNMRKIVLAQTAQLLEAIARVGEESAE